MESNSEGADGTAALKERSAQRSRGETRDEGMGVRRRRRRRREPEGRRGSVCGGGRERRGRELRCELREKRRQRCVFTTEISIIRGSGGGWGSG